MVSAPAARHRSWPVPDESGMAPRRAGLHPMPGDILEFALDESVTPRSIVESVVDLAIEVAREGREGRRIGTLLTIGDHHAVLARSRCLILDPLAGHPPEHRRIDDPNLRETIKELAQLDGGFVISTAGLVVSAARYFETSLPPPDMLRGLGSRHIAAASITRCTDALAVVVSESSIVRVFERGRLNTEILPELWLLRRFSPHVLQPRFTERPAENIAVISDSEESPAGANRQQPDQGL
jgi:diadenylate cyclase